MQDAAVELHDAVAAYKKEAASDSAAPNHAGSSGRTVLKAEAAAVDVMQAMQRLACRYTPGDESVAEPCVVAWVEWLTQARSQPLSLVSHVALHFPALLDAWCAASSDGRAEALSRRVELAMADLYTHAIASSRTAWASHGAPLRTLLPPLSFLTALARLRWSAQRFLARRRFGSEDPADGSGTAAASPACADVDFDSVARDVETCHAAKLTREVLLHAFVTMNWAVGSAVSTVADVAPFTWCLFLRCRSYALSALEPPRAADFFARGAAARLVAALLQSVVDRVCVCVEQHAAAAVHPDRVEQLCKRDVPCLVLLVRLWFSWIALAPNQPVERLTGSLVRLVNAAAALPGAYEAADAAAGVRFMEAVWCAVPLTSSELASAATAAPWSSAFPRAAAVAAVLEKETAVVPIA